ncbi:MAG: ABC transporter substrate-binding protein [Oscillospiraceae bacterium]
MKKIIAVLLVLCMITLTACGKPKEYKVSYDLNDEPINLDPQTASDSSSIEVAIEKNTGSVLAVGTEAYKMIGKTPINIVSIRPLQNGVISDYSVNNNGTIYTFTLDEDAKWEDETPITADDFIFTFHRLLSKDTNSPYYKKYFNIKNAKQVYNQEVDASELGVDKNDKGQLVITLEEKSDDFIRLLAHTSAMPCNKEYFDGTKGKYGLEPYSVLSNGAYSLGSWAHNQYIRLDKNENYNKKEQIKPNGISLWIDNDSSTKRLLDEKVISAKIDGFDAEYFDAKDFYLEPIVNTAYCLVFNQNSRYLRNRNLRLSLCYGFDSASMAHIENNSLIMANALIPPDVMIDSKPFRDIAVNNSKIKYNTDKAYQLYMQALDDISDSAVTNLKIIVPDIVPFAEYFSYPIQALQKDIGIYIGIEVLDQNEYKKRIANMDYDIALMKFSPTDGTANSILKEFHKDNNKNVCGYDREEFSNLIDIAQSSTSIEEIQNNLALAEQMLIDDGVIIPLFYKNDYLAVNNKINDITVNKYTGLISLKQATLK